MFQLIFSIIMAVGALVSGLMLRSTRKKNNKNPDYIKEKNNRRDLLKKATMIIGRRRDDVYDEDVEVDEYEIADENNTFEE